MTLATRASDDTAVVRATLAGVSPGVIVAAGDYAAGDVLSSDADNGEGVAWVLPNMARVNGGGGEILKLIITSSADALAMKFRLYLFNANPSASELDDNAALSIAAADRTKLIGYLENTADSADVGGVSFVQVTPSVPFPYKCAALSKDLYGVLTTVDAETGEVAGMTVDLQLLVRKY